MAEYIEREAAIAALPVAWDSAVDALRNAPAADVAPVVHGSWIAQEDWGMDTYYTCSACKEDFVTDDGTPTDNLWNYCPHCGAKMDGGGTDA